MPRRTAHHYACVGTALLLIPAFIALAENKPNPQDFPETANVLSARLVSTDTGVKVTHNPACDNPQGAFMKGFCAQEGTNVQNRTRRYIEVIATIGPNTYTLNGNKMPPPGQYKARFLDDGSIELMGPDAKGEMHSHKFKVVAIELTNKGK
jgi:hypothetical protein